MMPATPPFRQEKPVLAMALASVRSSRSSSGRRRRDVAEARAEGRRRRRRPERVGFAGTLDHPRRAGQRRNRGGAERRSPCFITVDPADALIGLADGKMQPQPVTVTVGSNEEAKIRIEKKGYVPQTRHAEGQRGRSANAAWRVYSLKPLPGTAAPKAPAGAKAPARSRRLGRRALPPPTEPPPRRAAVRPAAVPRLRSTAKVAESLSVLERRARQGVANCAAVPRVAKRRRCLPTAGAAARSSRPACLAATGRSSRSSRAPRRGGRRRRSPCRSSRARTARGPGRACRPARGRSRPRRRARWRRSSPGR